MTQLPGAAQNFFVLIASFAFALFAATRAVESLRDFHQSKEDLLHLNLMLLQAMAILIIATLPLVLSDMKTDIIICSYISFILSISLLIQLTFSLVKKKIKFYYKRISTVLFSIGIIVAFAYLINAMYWESVTLYCSLLFVGFLSLCYRYYIILGHFVSHFKMKSK